MLSDRFGAFEAIANASIKLACVAPEEELAKDALVPRLLDAVRPLRRVRAQSSQPALRALNFERSPRWNLMEPSSSFSPFS